jgi:regulatory protein
MKKNTCRPKGVPSADSLLTIATQYVGRYAASEQSLRRVLQNRIRRESMRLTTFADDTVTQNNLKSAIEMIIETYRASGVLNDAVFAEIKIRRLCRAGRSRQAIRQTLSHKGIASKTIENALRQNDADEGGGELKAATILARKRKLGPFRSSKTDAKRHRQDLATMAGAGFTGDIARAVLGGERPEEEFFDKEDLSALD